MGATLSQLTLFPWRWRSALHRSRKVARLESPPGTLACSPTSAWQPVLVILVDVLPLKQGDQGVQRWLFRCGKSNFYFLSIKMLIELWNTTSPKRSWAKSPSEITVFVQRLWDCNFIYHYWVYESPDIICSHILSGYTIIYYVLSHILTAFCHLYLNQTWAFAKKNKDHSSLPIAQLLPPPKSPIVPPPHPTPFSVSLIPNSWALISHRLLD